MQTPLSTALLSTATDESGLHIFTRCTLVCESGSDLNVAHFSQANSDQKVLAHMDRTKEVAGLLWSEGRLQMPKLVYYRIG